MHGISWLVVLSLPAFGLLAVRPGVSSSRRILAGTLALLLPVVGPMLAMLVRRSRGGKIAMEPAPTGPERRVAAGDVSRLAELPPVLERLISSDSAERLSALVDVASSCDATAISLLRWTIEYGPNEVVLDAALTLEEIDLRCEARSVTAREQLAALPTFEHAVEAADAAGCRVLSGLADPSQVAPLATEARDLYQLALELEPLRRSEVDEKLARLELAAGRATVALEIAQRLVATSGGEQRRRFEGLRDDAAFAARDFSQMSVRPRSPAVEVTSLVAHRARMEQRRTLPGLATQDSLRRTGS